MKYFSFDTYVNIATKCLSTLLKCSSFICNDNYCNQTEYATIYTIMAYLSPSPFRLKPTVFSVVQTLLYGKHRAFHVKFIACGHLRSLRAKRFSHFSFRCPYMLWLYLMHNYLREYTESRINIILVIILKAIGVNNLSKISNIFFNEFYKQINFCIKRIILFNKNNK